MKTLKAAFAVAMMMFAVTANALDFEFGYGQAHYKHDHNGRWYVEGYTRLEELTSSRFAPEMGRFLRRLNGRNRPV